MKKIMRYAIQFRLDEIRNVPHCNGIALVCGGPGPPLPCIEPGGIYAHSTSAEPPISGKGYPRIYPPISGILVTVGNYKNTPFSWFSREIFPRLKKKVQKYPPFPRKWERACGPLMHSSGGPGYRAWAAGFMVRNHIDGLLWTHVLNLVRGLYERVLHHKLSSLHKLSSATICAKFCKTSHHKLSSPAQIVVDDNLCCSCRSQILISQATICAGKMKPNCTSCRCLHKLTSVSRCLQATEDNDDYKDDDDDDDDDDNNNQCWGTWSRPRRRH